MALPSGYNRLEYIQSSGTQYTDTGFKANQNTRIVFDFVPVSTDGSYLFGARTSSSSADKFAVLHPGGASNIRDDFGSEMSNVNLVPSGQTRIDKNKNVTTIGGITVTHGSASFSSVSLFLFANNTGGTAGSMTSVRLLACQIYDNGTLVRNFIPCKTPSGEIGLWDDANGVFYANAGTGAFVAGPIAKYAKVEYIETSGTQYIDTGFIPNQDTRVVMDMEYTQLGDNAWVFGARKTSNVQGFGAFYDKSTTTLGAAYGTEQISGDMVGEVGTRYIYDLNKNILSINGTAINFTKQTFTAHATLPLFVRYSNTTFSAYAYLRMYSCQIYDNGTLVRDFVPVVRQDGTAGLLDRVNEVFYENAGTGTFVVGPDLDYTRLEHIESTGTQYVDTGFIPNQDTRVVMDCQAYSTYNGGSFPFGVRARLNNKAFAVALTDSQAFYNYASEYQFADYPNTLERMLIDANKNVATFVGSTTATISLASGAFVCNSALTLATFNNAGTPDVGDPAWVGAIWSCQIYDNGVLIRDYVPALRENGQIGLIDLVSGLFYANAGSDVFIAGPEIVDPDPPDPPEPPGPYEPPSFTEQTLAYLAALRYPFYKLCRLRFLQPDGSTAFSLDNNPKNRRSGAFIADGSISANLQNGKRRNATVTLSNLDSSFDYNVNTVWFGTEIAVDEGLVLPDGSEYYIQQGVFAIENPTEAVEPANRTATYNLVDKWSYLDGTLFGNLESTYEVPVGTNIFQPIQAILALDRGNGQPVDGVTPIFTEYYNSKTQALPDGNTASLIDSPYTLRIDSDNGTYADVLLGLAAMVNAWIGYDQTGALRIDPSQDDILDTNKPILWQFSMDEATFLGANYTVRNVDVYNDYIVLGELLDDNSQPAGRATNLDPRSDTNVQTIGRKTFRMSAPGFATDQQCQDLAVWKLKRSTSLQKAITISCSQLFHIEENGLVTIVRTDKPGSPVERHLVMGFTRPLTSNGEMQINAVSVQDFVTATVTSWPE